MRSQYWMLAIMVGFTTLALWLLAQAGAEAPALVAVIAPPGCGGSAEAPERRARRESPTARRPLQAAPFVNALDLEPGSGDSC